MTLSSAKKRILMGRLGHEGIINGKLTSFNFCTERPVNRVNTLYDVKRQRIRHANLTDVHFIHEYNLKCNSSSAKITDFSNKDLILTINTNFIFKIYICTY